MKTCKQCGKLFTPRHGNQSFCPGCKMQRLTEKSKKQRPTPRKVKSKYGTYHGKNWKCSVFPNCEQCPFPDCIDGTNREYVEIEDEPNDDI